ncbi:MAG: chorismate synthase [Butyrivibrio sp.]|nr:chorismate synthase [Butyrivibrio sp.]
MSGSVFGNNIKVSTFGESHGKALGCIIDGFPAGMELCENDIQTYLDRRKPGTSAATTSRKEDDLVEILSGVFEGRTTGTPIALMIKNTSHISSDYSEIASCYRPGHADYTFDKKFGFRDYRGGGRSSGRETAARVAAGALCIKLLSLMGVKIIAYTKSIGDIEIDYSNFDENMRLSTPTCMPDQNADKRAMELISSCREQLDSIGGVVECKITNVPAGIGEPVFDKLDALLSHAIMSIGAVKAIEIGDGIKAGKSRGSENNDQFIADENGHITKMSNHSGGILGGISDGSEIILRAHIKPTPSIARPQQTVSNLGQNIELSIRGRHDPVIVPRAVVVVESMCAITLLDLMMTNMHSKADNLIRFYS